MVISYSRSLEEEIDINDLMKRVWEAADKTGLFNPEAIRVRARPFDHYYSVEGATPFVHLDAKLFAGRTDEQKQMMAGMLFDCISGMVDPSVAISVEPIDIDKPNYVKR